MNILKFIKILLLIGVGFLSTNIAKGQVIEAVQKYGLQTIYNETGGENWSANQWNFDTETYPGVTFNTEGKVTSIVLPNSNLRGRFPDISIWLNALTTLDISSNHIEALPETLPDTLSNINVSNNHLSFGAHDFLLKDSIETITFFPQTDLKFLGFADTTTVYPLDSKFVINLNRPHPENQYNWYFKADPSAQEENILSYSDVNEFIPDRKGHYRCEVTNTNATYTNEAISTVTIKIGDSDSGYIPPFDPNFMDGVTYDEYGYTDNQGADQLKGGELLFPIFSNQCNGKKYKVGFYLEADIPAITSDAWGLQLQLELVKKQADSSVVTIMPMRTLQIDNYDAFDTLNLKDTLRQNIVSATFFDATLSCQENTYYFRIPTATNNNFEQDIIKNNVSLKVKYFPLFEDLEKTPNQNFDFITYYNSETSKTELHWDFADWEGARQFDIEWVYIDNQVDTDLSTIETIELPFDPTANDFDQSAPFAFKEPIRITTAQGAYQYTPHISYPEGWVFFRIRGVSYHPDAPNQKLYGEWQYTTDSSYIDIKESPLVNTEILPHQAALNWQYVSTFAEDGKYKKVMSFYDGSMRNRQTLTNLSTSGLTLIAETLYDFEGRGTVNALPVPINNESKLTYQSKFNLFNDYQLNPTPSFNRKYLILDSAAAEWNYAEDILELNNPDDYKTVSQKQRYDNITDRHSPSRKLFVDEIGEKGAAHYYKDGLPGFNQQLNDYLPAGEGYEYTQVGYTNDNTGRVSIQSGVGKTFRPKIASGADYWGKVTRYFYGSANKKEIQRLFGIYNVGDATHYKKNMVLDPNKQASISYLDQEGRVIATALAGDPPSNLEKVYGTQFDSIPPITIDISDKNITDIDQLTRSTSETFLKVSNELVNYNIHYEYDLNPRLYEIKYQYIDENSQNQLLVDTIEQEFVLELTLYDPYGNRIDLDGISPTDNSLYKDDYQQDNVYTTIINPCNQPEDTCQVHFDLEVPLLEAGNYTLVKKIKLVDARDEIKNKLRDYVKVTTNCTDLLEEDQEETLTTDPFFINENNCDAELENIKDAIFEYQNSEDCLFASELDGLVIIEDDDTPQETFEVKANDFIENLVNNETYNDYLNDTNSNTDLKNKLNEFIDLYHCNYTVCTSEQQGDTDFQALTQYSTFAAANGAGAVGPNICAKNNFADAYYNQADNSDLYYDPSVAIVKRDEEFDKIKFLNDGIVTEGTLCEALDPEYNDALKDLAPGVDFQEERWKVYLNIYQRVKMIVRTRMLYDATKDQEDLRFKNCGFQPYMEGTGDLYSTQGGNAVFNFDTTRALDEQLMVSGLGDITADSISQILNLDIDTITTADIDSDIDLLIEAIEVHGDTILDSLQRADVEGIMRPYFEANNVWGQSLVSFDFDENNAISNDTLKSLNDYLRDNLSFDLTQSPDCKNELTYTVDCPGGYNDFMCSSRVTQTIVTYHAVPSLQFDGVDDRAYIADESGYDLSVNEAADGNGNYSEIIIKFDVNQLSNGPIFAKTASTGNGILISSNNNTISAEIGSQTLTLNGLNNCEKNVKLTIRVDSRLEGIGDNCGVGIDLLKRTYTLEAGGQTDTFSDASFNCTSLTNYNFNNDEPIYLAHDPVSGNFFGGIIRNFSYEVKNNVTNGVTTFYKQWVLDSLQNTSSGSGGIGQVNDLISYGNGCANPDDCKPLEVSSYCMGYEGTEEISYCNGYTAPSLVTEYKCDNALFDKIATAKELNRLTQMYWKSLVNLSLNGTVDKIHTYGNDESQWENHQDSTGRLHEMITLSYLPKEYHYTLYYYDQAGNLVQTIPPKGVKPLEEDPATKELIGTVPQHSMKTRYHYNSLNQLVWQSTPDGGITKFWYDDKGQLRLSQNAEQYKLSIADTEFNFYSYTKYDGQGRINEVGVLKILDTSDNQSDRYAQLEDNTFPDATENEIFLSQQTKTYYDNIPDGITEPEGYEAINLRGRVALVEVIDKIDSNGTSTFYSYDQHGNVKSLIQKVPTSDGYITKKTAYKYDLVSGNVHYVMYQENQEDQFFHHYLYDADNRLIKVETSLDGVIWNEEATYHYFAHGPLARIELGEHKVQQLEYYYTLQGWIKGVNLKDKADHLMTSSNAFGYTLGYFSGDYKPIKPDESQIDEQQEANWSAFNNTYFTGQDNYSFGLYNGNIVWMTTDLNALDQSSNAMVYQYDQLNRIKKARSFQKNSSNLWERASGFNITAGNDYDGGKLDTQYEYDPNGNLISLKRYDIQGNLMDDLIYDYGDSTTNKLGYVNNAAYPSGTKIYNNTAGNELPGANGNEQLYSEIIVEDGASVESNEQSLLRATQLIKLKPNFHAKKGSVFSIKPVKQGEFQKGIATQQTSNYGYDEIGNIIWDVAERITIDWTVYGKVAEVKKYSSLETIPNPEDPNKYILNINGVLVATTQYRYDGAGNRVSKIVTTSINDAANTKTKTTYYVRDASGNIMANYTSTTAIGETELSPALKEQAIYGSSRLGVYIGGQQKKNNTLGFRTYELSNHLGNVLTVISDNKVLSSQGSQTGYASRVVQAQDYYPFGLGMEGRKYEDVAWDEYRFGFNGKENDTDFGNEQLIQDYGFRLYNPSIAKFLSVDPLFQSYPMLTPYQFASNMPIAAIDLDGLEADPVVQKSLEEAIKPTLTIVHSKFREKAIDKARDTALKKTSESLTSKAVGALGKFASILGMILTPANGGDYDMSVKRAEEHKDNLMVGNFTDQALENGGRVIHDKIFEVPSGTRKEEDDEGYIILFRGVSRKMNPRGLYDAALKGVAVPKGFLPSSPHVGGHTDPDDHSMSDNYSIWTSWSVWKGTAAYFATTNRGEDSREKPIINGVILIKKFHKSRLGKDIIQSNYAELMQEGEWLVPGVQVADKVEHLEVENE